MYERVHRVQPMVAARRMVRESWRGVRVWFILSVYYGVIYTFYAFLHLSRNIQEIPGG